MSIPAARETAAVRVSSLHKSFVDSTSNSVHAVDDLDLAVAPGEMVVLLGPSGCGKTTLLRCIAGLEQPDSGSITIGGRTVFSSAPKENVPTARRRISMMFQSYALWPHMTGFENVSYPLRAQSTPKSEIIERTNRALRMVGVASLANEYPGTMSGGQQQRVALARALVAESAVVLFDEPLSNVDAKLREEVRAEIAAMRNTLGFAGIYVTHDQVEALALADRLVVLDRGRIAQIGTPQEVYSRPTSRYVGKFVGSANELAGVVREAIDGVVTVETPIGSLAGTDYSKTRAVGDNVHVLFRPNLVRIDTSQDRGASRNTWHADVASTSFLGSHVELTLRIEGYLLKAWADAASPVQPGDTVRLSILPTDMIVVAAAESADSGPLS